MAVGQHVAKTVGVTLFTVSVTFDSVKVTAVVVGERMKNITGEIKLLNLSDLPAGIYFVKLHSADASITKKIVISK